MDACGPELGCEPVAGGPKPKERTGRLPSKGLGATIVRAKMLMPKIVPTLSPEGAEKEMLLELSNLVVKLFDRVDVGQQRNKAFQGELFRARQKQDELYRQNQFLLQQLA